jgi:hypothetical protein
MGKLHRSSPPLHVMTGTDRVSDVWSVDNIQWNIHVMKRLFPLTSTESPVSAAMSDWPRTGGRVIAFEWRHWILSIREGNHNYCTANLTGHPGHFFSARLPTKRMTYTEILVCSRYRNIRLGIGRRYPLALTVTTRLSITSCKLFNLATDCHINDRKFCLKTQPVLLLPSGQYFLLSLESGWSWMSWHFDRNWAHRIAVITDPCGGGLEYLHRRPASRKRRQKGNPVPGGITEPPCSWGI